ncbi:DHH family phosphoesterase [Nitratiruptor tergarcus]|uniref:Phosphoesterase RecJ domain-containing protein n=1 Tax=Nitratiruptor tergarcus DSM 16512 TaxID=1069081 RepID=A0A1W1WTM4_9BACT|nr:bifunctional oligoribonuclease/PAP phosphatase NrnA [Nitratiruptor tergarcus]SMC09093.1 phosphoesterase RecJ domain-containing protein [Nitratiruptor tergarcus DSM 16512]
MKEAWKRIEEATYITLLTHVNPDADTLGSALGMYHVLRKMGKKPTVVNVTPLPYNLDFLPGFKSIKKSLPPKSELLISFDCGSFDRLGIPKMELPLINFDHHRTNTLYGDFNIIDPKAAATSQVVYRFLQECGVQISQESALCFYTALVDDTGFFKYDSVNADVFAFAKELCEIGVVPEYVANQLTMREPLAKLRLLPLVLETLTLRLNAKVAILYLTQQMLKTTGATKEMADDALNMARSLVTVEVAMLLRQEENGNIKVSLRSKNFVDVGKIALVFGGGGHKRAAGFTSPLNDFKKVEEDILDILAKELDIEKK